MNGFIGQLKIRAFSPEEISASGGGAALYQLLEDFSYHSDELGLITAPAGLITDFASIPQAALSFIDDDAPAILFGSIIHDQLYQTKGRREGLPDVTRQQADALLAEMMGLCGAPRWQRAVVYRAVRLFGGSHWS